MTADRFPRFRCVAILGVGLMGGSVGLAIRARGLAERTVGWDPSADSLDAAEHAKAIDVQAIDPESAVHDADLIVIAAPVDAVPDLLERIAPNVAPNAIVTDLGSVKRRIVETGERLLGRRFIGGHPMAGSEESGVAAARSDLFSGAAWALVNSQVPDANNPNVARLLQLVADLGARPVTLDAETHDSVVAVVSHLPHVIAFAFAGTAAQDPRFDLIQSLAAGSYRDITRVAASDPALWRAILLDNRANVLTAIAAFRERLVAMELAVERDDEDALRSTMVTRTKE